MHHFVKVCVLSYPLRSFNEKAGDDAIGILRNANLLAIIVG